MKRAAFSMIMLLIVAVAAEIAARAAYLVIYDRGYAQDALLGMASERDEDLTPASPNVNKTKSALHPYLGYVTNTRGPNHWNTHGFGNSFHPEEPLAEDELLVMVTGGSLGRRMAEHNLEKTLNARLSQLGVVPRVRVFIGAKGGYKQPQQLFTLSYFTALGAKIDIVINVDGYNDIVYPYHANARRGIHPFFPMFWSKTIALGQSALDPLLIGEIAHLRRTQSETLQVSLSSPLAYSAFRGIWLTHDYLAAERRIIEIERQIQTSTDHLPFEQTGPTYGSFERKDVLSESADLWVRCSIMMQRLVTQTGGEYFHFIQPNQYLIGSKPLSAEEKERFFAPERKRNRIATEGFPLLLARASELKDAGVAFFDATTLFANEERTVYRDDCCHLNDLGNDTLVDYIVTQVTAGSSLLK